MRTVCLYTALVLTVLLHVSVAAIVVGVVYLAYLAFRASEIYLIIVGLILAWLGLQMILDLLFARPEPLGVLRERSEAPRLYALADELARRVGTQPPDEIYLVPDMGVSVEEAGGVLGLPFRSKRITTIGLAALQGLTVDHLRVILTHEMAHFRQGDTALSQFINRASLSLVVTLTTIRETTWWWPLNPAFWYLIVLSYLYCSAVGSLMRFTVSAEELRADLLAARICGRDVTSGALTETAVNCRIFDDVTRIGWETIQVRPLPNIYALHRKLRGNLSADEREAAIQRALDLPPDVGGDYPTLRRRLEALEALPEEPTRQRDDRPATSVLDDLETIETEQSRLMGEWWHHAIYVEQLELSEVLSHGSTDDAGDREEAIEGATGPGGRDSHD